MSVTLVFSPGICLPIPSPIDGGQGTVSNVVVSSWGLLQTVSATSTSTWNVTGYGISATQQTTWNAAQRIEAIQPYIFYGLSRPVVYPMDDKNFVPGVAWDTDYRTANTHASSWKVFYRAKARHAVTWNTRYREFSQKSASFRTLQRVYKPGLSNEELTNGVVNKVVHAIYDGITAPSPTSAWQLNQRRYVRETSRFNALRPVKVTKATAFNTKGILVSPQIASAWMLRKKVSPALRSTWILYRRQPAKASIAWRSLNSRSVSAATSWRFIDPAGRVTSSVASAWVLNSSLKLQQKIQWHLTTHQDTRQASAWKSLMPVRVRDWQLVSNSPGNIGTPIVHPIDFVTPAAQPPPEQTEVSIQTVHPISFSLYSGYGFTAQPGSTWRLGINPNGRVVARQASAFRTLNDVSLKQKIAWTAVGRISASQQVAYNQRNSVSVTAIMEWIMGRPIQGQIRQTSIDRTDFSY